MKENAYAMCFRKPEGNKEHLQDLDINVWITEDILTK